MRDDAYVLSNCTTYLARANHDRRHDFGFGHYAADDQRANIRDAWRFPVVDTCSLPPDGKPANEFNDVTFVYHDRDGSAHDVAVVGTFAPAYERLPLRRVPFLDEDADYLAATLAAPRRAVFFYKLMVDGEFIVDPVNPQRQMLDNGVEWSRFFTWECTRPVVLQRQEVAILERLCDHVLPFRTLEGQRFLESYYNGLDAAARQGVIRGAFRLDDSVGAANYIDKILAREESHHFGDYRICLGQLDRIIRQRDPAFAPENASRDVYVQLYHEMAGNSVNGWDYDTYGSPQFFLDLVRRHAFTGAFAHPKYGGNVSAAGWSYLESRFPFDWRQSLEHPLGSNVEYRG